MEKTTLKFCDLAALGSFSRLISGGFFINTCMLALTTYLDYQMISIATSKYAAVTIATTEKVLPTAFKSKQPLIKAVCIIVSKTNKPVKTFQPLN